jgi:hypothetical protein
LGAGCLAGGQATSGRFDLIGRRDVLALGVAALATAGLGALVIVPNVYPLREPLGYLPGTVLAYEFRVTKLSTGGVFDIRLDMGETLRVPATDGVGPGDRVCLRAVRRGDLIQGTLVALERCGG